MTVKKLRELLAQYPDDLPVEVADCYFGDPAGELVDSDIRLWTGKGVLINGEPATPCLLIAENCNCR